MSTTFTLFLDVGLCVGVLEVHEGGTVRAARHIFGAVPSDPELHAWLLIHGNALIDAAHSATPVSTDGRPALPRPVNLKRLARQSARESRRSGPATAARESLKQSFDLRAATRKKKSRDARHDAEEHRRMLSRAHRKARHRGH